MPRAPMTPPVTVEYAYRALDADGELLQGSVVAPDVATAAERIRRTGLRPVEVTRRRFSFIHREHRMPGGGGKRARHLALFARQFSTMAAAGTPLLRSLTILARQAEDDTLAEAIDAVRADIENGDSLSVAMSHRPDWFDQFVVSMVEAGERAGSLSDVLERLAEATERSAAIRRKVKSALAYPVAVGCLVVLTVIAMLMFLVPTFSSIYDDLGGDLPLPTRIITGISDLLTSNVLILFVLTVAAVVAGRRWARTDAGRRRVDGMKLRLPVFGPLVSRTALARFSRSLSVLVASGVPIGESLRIAGDTSGNTVVSDAVREVSDQVNGGRRISDALDQHEVFSPMVVQMVGVGEETGALDEMLGRVTELYDDEVSSTVDSLTASLEPILIMVMGLVVGAILLAVYLPMFQAVDLVK